MVFNFKFSIIFRRGVEKTTGTEVFQLKVSVDNMFFDVNNREEGGKTLVIYVD